MNTAPPGERVFIRWRCRAGMIALTVLGSGGNSPIPTPTCGCRVRERAEPTGFPVLDTAARGIVRAIDGERDVAYVPGRWWLVSKLLAVLPDRYRSELA